MATWTNNNATYYINPAYLTFVENSGYGANLIQVSASSSCYISVYIHGVIDYSDADKNYKRWKITAYNNKFPDNDKFYIYVRLEKESSSALVVYDKILRGVHGGEIVEKTNETGEVVREEGEYDPGHPYFYIHIGEVGETDGTSIRPISYDTGYLTSNKSNDDKSGVNDMWDLDKYSTPWLIRAKHWLASFTVKGFISLVGGLIFKGGDGSEKPVVDIKRSTDSDEDLPVSDDNLATSKYIEAKIEGMDAKYLRKDKDDRSVGKISSDKGFEVGNYIRGMIGGQGGYYYKDENGKVILELDKIHAREELIVPKLSFNCIDVVTGELAQTFAYGTIKSVDVVNQIATLDLLGDEYGTLHEDDICRGIFHFLNEENNSEYEVDHNKFHNYSGFSTSYFTPTEIITSDKGVMKFRYELQEGTTVHPTTGMNFFAYGNFSDTNRQSVTYQTRDYTRRLVNVDDWTINPDKNIAMQEGLLEGLTIGGMVMHGYGTFESNSYFTGAQIQFSPEQLEALRGESAIVMDLSNDTISIACDKDGVPTETVSSGSPKTTTLKVYYGLVRKELASLSASNHTGITISTDYTTGIVKVTGITSSAADSTEVTLTAEVEINGEYKEVSKVFTINKIKQGQTGQTGQTGGKGDAAVVYSIQPNNLPLSLVGGVVTPSTATFTCYKNTGMSTQETETAYWYAYRCNTGNERDYVLFASKESYVSSYNVTFSPSYKFYKIVAKPYGGVQTTAYAMYTQDGEGSPGENGYFPRDRGLFVSGERYYYSKDSSTGDIYRDKVVYEIEGTYYNFLVKSRNDNGYITAAPTSATGDSNWEVISQYRALIADTLFGSNANIGGFMASAEKLRTSSEVDDKPRFEIDGSQGTQTMRQDGGTVWAVNADGVQSIGFEDGERIVLDPNDKSISVFDSDGVQRTNIDGKEYTKSELIVSSGGTFSLSSYASNSSGRSLTSSNALGSVASYSLTSVLTFRYAGVAEVNISNFYMSLYHSARATSTGTPSVIPNGKAYIYLCTYTSSSASTLVSKRLVAYRNVSDATVDGSTTTTDRLSGTFSVSVPSGYHRIEVLMEVTNGSSIGSTTITAYWSLSSAKIVVESYMSRLFANGMMLSKSSDEYFMAMMDGDQMNVEAVTGSSGIRLNNGAIQLKYNNSGWFNMPITLLFARVTVSGSSGATISYKSFDGQSVSVSSTTEGIFNITIPSSWGVTASNTNIQATAYYRYRNGSTNAVCWATVNSVSSTSIQVITSYNNNNEFDHSGFYLEVKKFQ